MPESTPCISSGVGLGISLGVNSSVNLGLGSGVGSGISSGVGLGLSLGVHLGISLGISSGVSLGIGSGVGLGIGLVLCKVKWSNKMSSGLMPRYGLQHLTVPHMKLTNANNSLFSLWLVREGHPKYSSLYLRSLSRQTIRDLLSTTQFPENML